MSFFQSIKTRFRHEKSKRHSQGLFSAGGLFSRKRVDTALSLVPLTDATLAQRADSRPAAKARPASCLDPELQPVIKEEVLITVQPAETTKLDPTGTLTNESGTMRYRPSSADMSVIRRAPPRSRTAIIESWRADLVPKGQDGSVTTTMSEEWTSVDEATVASEQSSEKAVCCTPDIASGKVNPTPWPHPFTDVPRGLRHPSVRFKHITTVDPDRYTRKYVKVALVPLTRTEINIFHHLKQQMMMEQGHNIDAVGPLTKGRVLAALKHESMPARRPASTGSDMSSQASQSFSRHAGLRLLKLGASRFGNDPDETLWDMDPFTRQVFVVEPAWQAEETTTACSVASRTTMRASCTIDQQWKEALASMTEKRKRASIGQTLALFEPVSTIRLVKH
ncbi:hypothetical protein BCR37DRAFT_385689 [Protomyces lactucae-debilis]|uniref:Uncharacterized protein n=1 Tax=Protomyces lactucae-debilis TaxID=2754530 RepID=A0A1Y2FQF2_PROLT|nr:uncharacterized protein BCR37DRAFT_385689 [Protomyces lactucae-debilis]ORY86210.1 hypothetical protein BCR37DRAFT_385689 [Protomyces lactucae-debilis]